MALMLETDPSEMLNEIIYATRKGGNIGIGAHGVWGTLHTCVQSEAHGLSVGP